MKNELKATAGVLILTLAGTAYAGPIEVRPGMTTRSTGVLGGEAAASVLSPRLQVAMPLGARDWRSAFVSSDNLSRLIHPDMIDTAALAFHAAGLSPVLPAPELDRALDAKLLEAFSAVDRMTTAPNFDPQSAEYRNALSRIDQMQAGRSALRHVAPNPSYESAAVLHQHKRLAVRAMRTAGEISGSLAAAADAPELASETGRTAGPTPPRQMTAAEKERYGFKPDFPLDAIVERGVVTVRTAGLTEKRYFDGDALMSLVTVDGRPGRVLERFDPVKGEWTEVEPTLRPLTPEEKGLYGFPADFSMPAIVGPDHVYLRMGPVSETRYLDGGMLMRVLTRADAPGFRVVERMDGATRRWIKLSNVDPASGISRAPERAAPKRGFWESVRDLLSRSGKP